MKQLLAAALAAVSISHAAGAFAQTRTDSLPVGICVNMGNHLEAPQEGEWGRKISDDDFAIIAAAGFQTVRIPVRWANKASETSPYTIDAAFMARVKNVVGQARAAGLNVILNSHHFEALDKDPAANAEKLGGLWKQVAAEFQNEPRDHVWFEIHNEPNSNLKNDNLLATLTPALAAIRMTNPDRPVIIGGENWMNLNSLETLKLPDDPNIVPTFHYYDPFEFTHQGATWVENPPPLGRTFGTDADLERLDSDVKKLRAYMKKSGKTPFLGEFGAHDTIPVAGRIKYQQTVSRAFQAAGIGTCAWGYAATFPLYDDKQKRWIPGMREAMGLKK